MDSAFATKPYPGYSTSELLAFVANGRGTFAMLAEINRRESVAAGDYSDSTAGERLRAVRQGKL